MVSTEIRDRRRTLRYRHLIVRQMVQMKNRVSGLLLETGVTHNKRPHSEARRKQPCHGLLSFYVVFIFVVVLAVPMLLSAVAFHQERGDDPKFAGDKLPYRS